MILVPILISKSRSVIENDLGRGAIGIIHLAELLQTFQCADQSHLRQIAIRGPQLGLAQRDQSCGHQEKGGRLDRGNRVDCLPYGEAPSSSVVVEFIVRRRTILQLCFVGMQLGI